MVFYRIYNSGQKVTFRGHLYYIIYSTGKNEAFNIVGFLGFLNGEF